MNRALKQILLTTFFMAIVVSDSLAQAGNQSPSHFKHHVIVLMDGSGSVKRMRNNTYSNKSQIRSMLTGKLKDVCFKSGILERQYLNPQRPLLDSGDYLSVLSFGFEKESPNLNDFIEPVAFFQGNKPVIYTPSNALSSTTFNGLWQHIDRNYYRFFNKNWTGLSFAGPMALGEVKSTSSPTDINRTFIIMITDGVFNDISDPNNELKVIGRNEDGTKTRVKGINDVLPRYNKIREAFLWDKIFSYQPGKLIDDYKMEILEFKPLQRTFAIEAIVPFENEFLFKRTPDDEYLKELKVTPYQSNKDFRIERMLLRLEDTTTSQVLQTWDFQQVYTTTTKSLTIPDNLKKSGLVITAKFWVHYDDGIYGSHVLHPDGGNLQGQSGLNRVFPVTFEPSERIVFNALPLPEPLYKTSSSFLGNSQGASAIFWDLILMVLALVISVFIIRRALVIKE